MGWRLSTLTKTKLSIKQWASMAAKWRSWMPGLRSMRPQQVDLGGFNQASVRGYYSILMSLQSQINSQEEFLSFGKFQFETLLQGFVLDFLQLRLHAPQINLAFIHTLDSRSAPTLIKTLRVWTSIKQENWLQVSLSTNYIKLSIDAFRAAQLPFKAECALGLKADRIFRQVNLRSAFKFFYQTDQLENELKLRFDYSRLLRQHTFLYRYLLRWGSLRVGVGGRLQPNLLLSQSKVFLGVQNQNYQIYLRAYLKRINGVLHGQYFDTNSFFKLAPGTLLGLWTRSFLEKNCQLQGLVYLKIPVRQWVCRFRFCSLYNFGVSLTGGSEQGELTLSVTGNSEMKQANLGMMLRVNI